MAQQVINVGQEANDGTGDPVRIAMIKANSNFTELYNRPVGDEGTGNFSYNYDDLFNKPTIPADIGDLTDNNNLLSNEGTGNSSLQSRSTISGTTVSLASSATGNLNITGFKSYALLAIQTDRAAWVRIYANNATRSADVGRLETSDPAPDAGVIAEVITTGAQTVLVSPGALGYNFESTPTTTIPCSITNKSATAGTVTVTLTAVQLEA